jgi:hypothetical protein
MSLRVFLLAVTTLPLAACSGTKEQVDSGLDTGADTATDTVETGDTGAPGGDTFTHAGSVVNGERWATGTHIVTQSFSVEGGILEIEPCSTIFMPPGSMISVSAGGAIRAIGTPQCAITFLSANGSPAAGDWGHIAFQASAESGNNIFEHVKVLHAGGASHGAIWLDTGASLSMTASSVRQSGGVGVELVNGAELRNFAGNTLTDNADAGISLGANEADQLGEGIYGPNAVEGVRLRSATVDHGATWLNLGEPWVAEEGFSVAASGGSATLTVAAGSTLELGADAVVSVYDSGALVLDGTEEARVRLTSSKSPAAPGDWLYVEIHGSALDSSHFGYADIAYGGGSVYGQVWLDEDARLTLDHAAFTEAGGGCDVSLNPRSVLEASASSYAPCAI